MNFENIVKPEYDIVVSNVPKIDASNAPELKELFLSLQNNSKNRIIVDLTKADYCDSSGLSAILFGHRFCKNTNGIFILSGIQPMVEKLIKIAQLDKIISIENDIVNAEKRMMAKQ